MEEKKQTAGREMVKNMKYLVKMLHREWERSGRTKAEVAVTFSDTAEVKKRFAEVIRRKQRQLDTEGLSFRESMELSRENFILLRVVKKVVKAEEKSNRTGMKLKYTVELDKEEYRQFCEIIGIQEA